MADASCPPRSSLFVNLSRHGGVSSAGGNEESWASEMLGRASRRQVGVPRLEPAGGGGEGCARRARRISLLAQPQIWQQTAFAEFGRQGVAFDETARLARFARLSRGSAIRKIVIKSSGTSPRPARCTEQLVQVRDQLEQERWELERLTAALSFLKRQGDNGHEEEEGPPGRGQRAGRQDPRRGRRLGLLPQAPQTARSSTWCSGPRAR